MPAFSPVILSSPRLTLRWFEERDVAAHYLMHTDPEVARYIGRSAWTDRTQAETSIAQKLEGYASGESVTFALELKETAELVGNVTLFAFDHQNRRAELGYLLARPFWGHGYAIEAVTALLDYGFGPLDLHRLEADIDPRNLASAKLLERLRFKQEGYMPERWLVDGEPSDTAFYGLLKREWAQA